MKVPKATLVSTSEYPIETLYCLWQASRSNDELETPEQIHYLREADAAFDDEVMATFAHIIRSDIPVAENLDFVFMLENIPISLREQIVRHRIGHRYGENFGVDLIPGEGMSSWWSQSMRILNMGTFATEGNYYTPNSILEGDKVILPPDVDKENMSSEDLTFVVERATKALGLYQAFMKTSEDVYSLLVDAGIPLEDARQVIPLAAASRISWKMNYMSLKHVLARRGCWIAQLGMWQPLIFDMVRELSTKIHPIFRELVKPPCFSNSDSFVGCPFPGDNVQRLIGISDPEPPCPLFLHHHSLECGNVPPQERKYHPSGLTWDCTEPRDRERFQSMQSAYRSLWGRNVWTGEKI